MAKMISLIYDKKEYCKGVLEIACDEVELALLEWLVDKHLCFNSQIKALH
jgi:hypothetical protein